MRIVLPVHQPLPLFDLASTRRIEQQALATSPPQALMQRAGSAVARLALALAPHADRVWIAAGPGNNGGDGLEAAVHLHQAGKQVDVSLFADPAALPADAAAALARAQAAGVKIGVPTSVTPTLGADDLAIDALLGIGASRPPSGQMAEVIRAFNALPCRQLAIDLPSGMNMRTGQPLGEICVVASDCLALLTLKPGLFTGAGRDHAGRIWLSTLGVDTAQDAPDAWLIGAPASISTRQHAQHKGSFGDVAVVGGARGMVGAAVLAARAAHAAGAGRVHISPLDELAASHDFIRPELMFRARWWQSEPAVLAASTVVCGCGGGDAVRTALPRLISLAARLVLDADALNAVAADSSLQTMLAHRAARGQPSVLTPHPLEAARLLGSKTAEVQADRLRAAQTLAERFTCVVVLKGSGSIVSAAGHVPLINSTGNGSLATAGTGDVLAGWLGGTWAQARANGTADGMRAAFESASRAVAEHGAAAEPDRPGPMRAGDLVERLYRQLRGA